MQQAAHLHSNRLIFSQLNEEYTSLRVSDTGMAVLWSVQIPDHVRDVKWCDDSYVTQLQQQ
jgi:hypothetical protein